MTVYDEITTLSNTNPKVLFRLFAYTYTPFIRTITLPLHIHYGKDKEAILIEFRKLRNIEFILRNTIIKLGSEWSYTIVCGIRNETFMRNIVSSLARNIKIIVLPFENLCPTTYSELLSQENFWTRFHGNKLLIYQEDSCIFKYGSVDKFLKWDYIGAPWLKTQNDNLNVVGNGGFSLRTKQCMIDVIRKISIQNTKFNSCTLEYIKNSNLLCPPEDVYFSLNMINMGIGKVADWDSAKEFSSESVHNPYSFAGHNFWLSNPSWIVSLQHRIFPILLLSFSYKVKIESEDYIYFLTICKYFIENKSCIVYLCMDVNQHRVQELIVNLFGKSFLHAFIFFPSNQTAILEGKADYHITQVMPFIPQLKKGELTPFEKTMFDCRIPEP